MLRLQAALPALAAGEPVGNVARRVGYDTPSAFVAAFRRETGLTPSAFFHDAQSPGPEGPGRRAGESGATNLERGAG